MEFTWFVEGILTGMGINDQRMKCMHQKYVLLACEDSAVLQLFLLYIRLYYEVVVGSNMCSITKSAGRSLDVTRKSIVRLSKGFKRCEVAKHI